MEIRLTLRPGAAGTKKLLARYGERLVCVRYRYDKATGRRVKTAELIVQDVAWAGRARRPRRHGRVVEEPSGTKRNPNIAAYGAIYR